MRTRVVYQLCAGLYAVTSYIFESFMCENNLVRTAGGGVVMKADERPAFDYIKPLSQDQERVRSLCEVWVDGDFLYLFRLRLVCRDAFTIVHRGAWLRYTCLRVVVRTPL